MRATPSLVVVGLGCLLVADGCVGLQLRRSERTGDDDDTFTAATEDGARYVKVEGGMLSTRQALARRWQTAARRSCDGDYVVLSDAGFERRRLGVVEHRTHEGYVRCVLDDPQDEAPAATASAERAAR